MLKSKINSRFSSLRDAHVHVFLSLTMLTGGHIAISPGTQVPTNTRLFVHLPTDGVWWFCITYSTITIQITEF